MQVYRKKSEYTQHKNPHREPIILIYQFFIHSDKERYNEIKECLKFNVENNNISKIILPNERIYNDDELGIKSDKIIQVNIKKRITYSDIFDLVDSMDLNGYIITCNADIFFDNTLLNIYSSGIHKEKVIYAQLRFEYTDKDLSKCKLFEFGGVPRGDSQDTWIFHSKYNIERKHRYKFNFNYGQLGCDNKIAYLFHLLGYNIKNNPLLIKSFHNHVTEIRNYNKHGRIPGPYLCIGPYLKL